MYFIEFEENNLGYYIEKINIKNDKIFIESKTLDKNKAKIFNSIEDIVEKYNLYINNKQIDWTNIKFIKIEEIKEIKIKKCLKNYWKLLVEKLKFHKVYFDDIKKIVINKKYMNKEEFKKICKNKFVENFRFSKEAYDDKNLIILIGDDFILAEIYDDYQNYLIKLELPIEK